MGGIGQGMGTYVGTLTKLENMLANIFGSGGQHRKHFASRRRGPKLVNRTAVGLKSSEAGGRTDRIFRPRANSEASLSVVPRTRRRSTRAGFYTTIMT